MRQIVQATTTGRLYGGPAAEHVVDLSIIDRVPSQKIVVKVYEGAAIAVDQLPAELSIDEQTLLADGWIRYVRATPVPPQGQPWMYVWADA